MKLKPVNDKIVVKPTKRKEEERTSSGIILPDSVESGGLEEGQVVSVGAGMHSANGTIIPICVEAGDTILYSKHNGGQEYKLNGEELLIMSQNEVLSILESK